MKVGLSAAFAAMHKMTADSAPAPARQEAWLLELERARWNAQPRYERLGNDGHASAEPATPVSETPDASLPLLVHGLDPLPLHGRVLGATGGVLPASSLPQSSLTQVDANQQAPVQTTTAAAAVLEPAVANASEPSPEPVQAHTTQRWTQLQPQSHPQWQARAMHVFVGEQTTSVWVRDSRLQARDAERLLQALRPALGHAQASAQTVQLKLNGHDVHPQRLD